MFGHYEKKRACLIFSILICSYYNYAFNLNFYTNAVQFVIGLFILNEQLNAYDKRLKFKMYITRLMFRLYLNYIIYYQ